MTGVEGRAARLAAGAALVAERAFVVTAGRVVLVFSDAPGVAGYTVEHGRCPCPDATVGFAARHGLACKHAVAAGLALAALPRPAAPRFLPPREEIDW